MDGPCPVTAHAVIVPVVSVLVLFLPGLVLGLLAGLRAGPALVVAPLLTYGVTTLTATVASYVSLTWNPVTLVVATLVVAAVVLGVRALTGRGRPWRERLRVRLPGRPGWRDAVIGAGVLLGGGISAGVLLKGFGNFGAPNQDYDFSFHANAVRLISDTGKVAPRALRAILNWEQSSYYYPNTFHAVAALVRDLTGATVFEVLNGQAMIVCLVAGLGLAGLLRRLGAPLAVVATTPVLLAGFASFPYDVLWRGPLLPFAAGVAVVPALILLLDVLLVRRRIVLALLFGLAAAGLLGVHPSAALAGALFALVFVLFHWWRSPRSLVRDLPPLIGSGVVAVLAALPAVVGATAVGADGAKVDWPAIETAGQATGDLLLLDHAAPGPQYWLAGLVVVGLLAVHRARYLWAWLAGAGVMVVGFVMAASSDAPIVETLTRPWWNDRWRFAALAVLGLAPLAAHGLLTLAQFGQRVLRRLAGARAGRLRPAAVTGALAALLLVVVVVASGGLYAHSNALRMAGNYQRQTTLNTNEIASMRWLKAHSSGGTIMNDANDGSDYLSAVAGLHPLFGHVVEPGLIPTMGRTQQLLLEHFNCLDSDAAVRAAVARLHIRYVFLGSGFVRSYMHRVPGLQGLAASPSLRLIHTAPGVRIYAVHLAPSPTAPIPACTLDGNTARATG